MNKTNIEIIEFQQDFEFELISMKAFFIRNIERLKNDCFSLRQRVDELKLFKTMLETREIERQELDSKKYVTEIRFHTRFAIIKYLQSC